MQKETPKELFAGSEIPLNKDDPAAETSTSRQPDISQFKEKRVLDLSVTQIVMGVICALLHGILIGYVRNDWSNVGHGIWGGAVFIICGSIGVSAAKTKTLCMIKAAKRSSIISAAVSAVVLGLGINGAVVAEEYTYVYSCQFVTPSYWTVCDIHNGLYWLEVAVESSIAVFSFVNGLLALWTCAICLKTLGTCCCCCFIIKKMYHCTLNYLRKLLFPKYDDSPQMVFNEQQVLCLSKTHVIVGIICIVFNTVTLAIDQHSDLINTSHGIWGGVVFIATGVIGVYTVKRKTKCMIMALKWSSAVLIVISLAVIGLAIATAACSWERTPTALHTLIAIFSALSGLLALWSCHICLQALGQSFGFMLYYGYQVPYNGTSQLVFTPQQQQQQEKHTSVKLPEGAPMYTGIGFSFPSYNPQSAMMNPVEPPPYPSPHTKSLDVDSGNPPAIVEHTAVTIPEEPNK